MENDDLLRSLELNNLYLEMLQLMRRYESLKGEDFGCRPTNAYILYSTKTMYGLTIVDQQSWDRAVWMLSRQDTQLVHQPIGYNLDHAEIAKPAGKDGPVYVQVRLIINSELDRVAQWTGSHAWICDPDLVH